MNFWVACLYYHCRCIPTLFKMISVLFKFLQLNDLYSFKNRNEHTQVLKILIRNHAKDLQYFIESLGDDLWVLCIDWYFCLLCDKVPI